MKTIDYRFGLDTRSLLHRHFRGFQRSITPIKILNAAIFAVENIMKPARSHSKPFFIKIEPTNCCNLDCPGCTTHGSRAKGYMKPNFFRELISAFGQYCMRISLYGQGESFLHRDIYDMIGYAEKNRCPVSISSNFTTVKEKDAHKLLDSGLDYLIVCVDGATQASHARYRRGSDYQAVMSNLETLLRLRETGGYRRPRVEVQSIAFDYTIDEIPKISEVCKSIGVDVHRIRRNMFSPGVKRPSRRDCPFMWGSIFITWDGKVYPCEEICNHDSKSYTPFSPSMTDADYWNNERMIELRSALVAPSMVKQKSPCEECMHFG